MMDAFVAHPRVERVLGHGETKSSVLLQGGFQADLRLVPPESRGAAMQYFTGSKAHNIALRDRAVQRGLQLNEVRALPRGRRIARGRRHGGRHLRRARHGVERTRRCASTGGGEGGRRRARCRRSSRGTTCAATCTCTTETDGRDTLEAMADAAHRRGYEYIAITRPQPGARDGQRPGRAARPLAHAARMRALNGRFEGLTLLAGIEVDILGDGAMDLSDDCLAQLDHRRGVDPFAVHPGRSPA